MAGREGGRGWIAFAVLSALLGVVGAVAAAPLLLDGRWFEGLLGFGLVRAAYWFTLGAWIRTPWADRGDVDPLPVPPPLTERRLQRFVAAAGVAVVATTLALGLQAIDGRWIN